MHIKCSMPGVEIICFEKKGYTTPLFSINKDGGARWPLLCKGAQRQWDLLQPIHPEYQMVQLFWAAEWCGDMSCQTFSMTGCRSSFLCVLTSSRKHCFFVSGLVCLQGPSHEFPIPQLGRHVRFPLNSVTQGYSTGKTGKGSSKPINSSRIK